MQKIEITRLDNGLIVTTQNRPDISVCYIYLTIGCGSMYESEEENGLSHFVEHCLFSGTEKRPNEDAIWRCIEEIGGSMNAFTGKDSTSIFCRLIPKYIEQGIELISDIAINPKFTDANIKKEKDVILSELLKTSHNIIPESFRILLQKLFPKHPIRQDILGTKKTLSTFDCKSLANFHRKHYVPSNISLSVVGSVNHLKIVDLTKKYFNVHGKFKHQSFEKYVPLEKTSLHTSKSKNDQATIAVGFRTPNIFDKKSPLMHLMSYSLGEMATFGVRNIIRFREGLAYSVKSGWNGYVSGSYSSILVNSEGNKINEITDVIQDFLEVFCSEKLNEETFSRILNSFLGSYMSEKENPDIQAKHLGYCSLRNTPHLLNIEKELSEITPDTILDVANKYFKNYEIIKILPKT